MKVRKIAVKRLMRDEKGQALLATLLLLLVGMLIVTPVLNFMGTGVKTGRVYEQKIDEIYAADSGVEDALWYIRNDGGESKPLIKNLLGEGYDEYDYSTHYPYPYDLLVNDKDVAVNITNVWIPKDITPSGAKQIIEDEKLLIIGYPSSTASTYTIKIVWEGTGTALKVKTIGIWLSPGFEYTEYSGSCSLQGQSFYRAPAISLYKGGTAVVWTFTSQPSLQSFPGGTSGPPMEETFTFKYTSPEAGQIPELVSSWIDTTGVSGITYTWDDSIRLYKIVSEAGGVQIEAYGAKTKFRKLKSTISSDYAVAGNTLMEATAESEPDSYARDMLYAESTSTITRTSLLSIPPSGILPAGKIPEEAIIDHVYLYWSGWIDYHYWYQSGDNYYWGEIPALRYNSNTKAQLMTNSKVDQVKFAVGSSAQTITADEYQIVRTADCGQYSPTPAPQAWDYACFKDVTDLTVSGGMTVREYIEEAIKSAGIGTVTFTVGHADAVRGIKRGSPGSDTYCFNLTGDGYTGYPLATPAHKRPDMTDETYDTRYQYAYAGWSLIILYRSPALVQRQLYLYDDFRQVSAYGWPDVEEFIISGFLAPPPISANDKSHVTYFTGEGDAHYCNDRIKVNNQALCYPPDAPNGPCDDDHNPSSNVFNSYSNALPDPDKNSDGIDIDTFVLPDNLITPYSTSANVKLTTDTCYTSTPWLAEMYTLVYLIVSFRSELTTGGIITNYAIKLM